MVAERANLSADKSDGRASSLDPARCLVKTERGRGAKSSEKKWQCIYFFFERDEEREELRWKKKCI